MNPFKKIDSSINQNVWARPEMAVTFRAEIMPGENCEERTFRIEKVLQNERVILRGFAGEHRQGSFEPINFKRKKFIKSKSALILEFLPIVNSSDFENLQVFYFQIRNLADDFISIHRLHINNVNRTNFVLQSGNFLLQRFWCQMMRIAR